MELIPSYRLIHKQFYKSDFRCRPTKSVNSKFGLRLAQRCIEDFCATRKHGTPAKLQPPEKKELQNRCRIWMRSTSKRISCGNFEFNPKEAPKNGLTLHLQEQTLPSNHLPKAPQQMQWEDAWNTNAQNLGRNWWTKFRFNRWSLGGDFMQPKPWIHIDSQQDDDINAEKQQTTPSEWKKRVQTWKSLLFVAVAHWTASRGGGGWFVGSKAQGAVWFVFVCVCVVDGCPSFCRCCFDQHRSFNGIEMMVGMVFPPPCLVLNFDSFLWWLWWLLIHLRLGCFNSFWCSPPSLGKIPILTTISLMEMMQFHQHTHLVGENIITFSNPTQAHEAVHFQQKPRRLMMCWRCLPGYLFNWSELVYLP